MKRVIDVAIAGTLLVLASPILLAAAIAIKLGDGGSVLFRQTRVGQDGCTFELLKLRTMVPNAEERLVDLTFANERRPARCSSSRRTRAARRSAASWRRRASTSSRSSSTCCGAT